jgi:malate synthase
MADNMKINIIKPVSGEYSRILTPEALQFIGKLHREFNRTRLQLLKNRTIRQTNINSGELPDFLTATKSIRESNWSIGPIPDDLRDRRVEITGPVSRKMVINALNSGAKTFMADFEDSSTPTWDNMLEGQINLRDAVNRTIRFDDSGGKQYALKKDIATLMVRPRGWHLVEKNILIDNEPVSGSLFDFGLYFFHNARTLLDRGTGPYFYLPKLESHLEARLWNDVFLKAQDELDIPKGSIKATVLIETILAAFEMDEILYELKDHSAGLNCGRWDYIFSCIKKFQNDKNFCFADRSMITMTTHFMRSYSLLAIKTCHRRGAHAIGGMAAQIPIRDDLKANEAAMDKVKADKEREAGDGHDGTWAAHPGLVPIALDAFDRRMPDANQINRQRDDVVISASDLLDFGPKGPITEAGLRTNINVGLQYMGAWLTGLGCVPVFNLMEDAATAEISRSQIWQWINSPNGILDDGRKVTVEMFRKMLPEELRKVKEIVGVKAFSSGSYETAARLLDQLVTDKSFVDFLTLPAYDLICP